MEDSLEILPVTPFIGAEVIGIGLSEPLTNHQKKAIHKAFLEHSVLFFRNQDISVEQQKDFGRSFGELHIHPARDRNGLEGHPEILYLNAGPDTSRVNGDEWHSDVSCDEEPPLGSILRLFEGITEEIIGDFGLSGGGAAGFELDRADTMLGTPLNAVTLASSEGHDESFVLVPEDILTHHDTWPHKPIKELIRADIVYF